MRFLQLSILSLVFTPSIARAHWGHVGEFAGHGHVIAIGALAAAAALAAALRKPDREAEESEVDDEVEGETA